MHDFFSVAFLVILLKLTNACQTVALKTLLLCYYLKNLFVIIEKYTLLSFTTSNVNNNVLYIIWFYDTFGHSLLSVIHFYIFN